MSTSRAGHWRAVPGSADLCASRASPMGTVPRAPAWGLPMEITPPGRHCHRGRQRLRQDRRVGALLVGRHGAYTGAVRWAARRCATSGAKLGTHRHLGGPCGLPVSRHRARQSAHRKPPCHRRCAVGGARGQRLRWGLPARAARTRHHLSVRASNLSGGQRQRLALARALLHESPVYIFDEAASNVDVESEDVVMGVVRGLARDRTVMRHLASACQRARGGPDRGARRRLRGRAGHP